MKTTKFPSENIERSIPKPSFLKRQISIVSWNTLSQYLFESTPHWYTHVPNDGSCSWSERFPRIMDEISSLEADIICLQEVEFVAYSNDFYPSMKMLGYDGIMQSNKRKSKTTGYGLATFWKKNKFELIHELHRSRTMATLLKESAESEGQSKVLALINCHLEGNPTKSVTRVKQLQHILAEISAKYTHQNIIVCGDFNCIMNKSACSTYLEKGTCKDEDILEWGRLVKGNTEEGQLQDIQPHLYNMHSAYPAELIEKDPMDYITFANGPGQFTSGLDQIWFHDTSDSIEVKALKHPFHSQEHRRLVIENGLPSIHNPSDHLPIGCVLEWKDTGTEQEIDLRHKEMNFVTRNMTATEAMDQAMKLLNTCSFDSEEQRADFLFVISEVPGLNDMKGKPTEYQITQIRLRREKKKELMEIVSKEQKHIMEEIAKLTKAAQEKSKIK